MLTASDVSPVHISFKKGLKAWVGEEILYDMDPAKIGTRECLIAGFSSYAQQVLTAQIIVKEGKGYATGWADVPLHVLFSQATRPAAPLPLSDLVYHNNPDEFITFTHYPLFNQGPCWAFFKNRNEWMSAEYLGTVDWYRDNVNLNFLRLANGQFALLPYHKIQFNGGPAAPAGLPPYKKSHQTWQV